MYFYWLSLLTCVCNWSIFFCCNATSRSICSLPNFVHKTICYENFYKCRIKKEQPDCNYPNRPMRIYSNFENLLAINSIKLLKRKQQNGNRVLFFVLFFFGHIHCSCSSFPSIIILFIKVKYILKGTILPVDNL
jgi:hypothetical protein